MPYKIFNHKNRIMKKVVLVVLAAVTFASCTQSKVGVVNTEKLITDYKETVKAEADIKAKQEKAGAEIELAIKSFQTKVAEYQKAAGKMSKQNRAKAEQQLSAEQQAIQQQQQQLPYQIQNEGAEIIKTISEKVNTYVKDYGKKNGYQIIFGTVNLNGAVMYNEEKVDLTDMLLKELNAAYEKGDAKEETKEVKEEDTKEEKKEEVKEEAK